MPIIRGVIAAAGSIELRADGGVVTSPILGPEHMRYYALYWDRVLIPANRFIYHCVPDEDVLVEAGAIERPMIPVQPGPHFDAAKSILLEQEKLAKDVLLRDAGTDWVLHQIGEDLTLSDEGTIAHDIFRVRLANVLPVPDPEVQIADVPEFKHRRKDELLALHEAMDELYAEILKSPDKSLASKQVISRFGDTIRALDKTSSERFKVLRKFDFSVELKLSGADLTSAAAKGAFVDALAGFTIPIGTFLGAAASLISVTAKSSKTLEAAVKTRTKLAYLSKASQEKLISTSRRRKPR